MCTMKIKRGISTRVVLAIHAACCVAAIVFSTSDSFASGYSNECSKETLVAAQKGLEDKVRTVSPSMAKRFGFASYSDVSRAELGNPYQEIYVRDSELASDNVNIEKLFVASGTWIFPVVVGGQTRSLLFVKNTDDEGWKAVGFGASVFAERIRNIERTYPEGSVFRPVGKIVILLGPKDFYLTVSDRSGNLGFANEEIPTQHIQLSAATKSHDSRIEASQVLLNLQEFIGRIQNRVSPAK